jgi:RimJ/RimL family protein N-acetyltransferase
MSSDYIHTKRLVLRPLSESDAFELFILDSDPEVMRFLGNKPVMDLNVVHNNLKNVVQQYIDFGIGRWAVVEKETGLFAGWAGLKFIDKLTNGHTDFYDVGYRLKPQFWGKGYATEATEAWIDYAKETLQLNELFAITHIDNYASQNVLKKCGFEQKNRFLDTLYQVECYWWRLPF